MHLTESWLRNQSTPASFERGQGYFDRGLIQSVQAFEGFYRAEVQGTERYHQLVDLRTVPPSLTCTCPYQSGGYCKHLVAVGLAILEGQYAAADERAQTQTDGTAPVSAELIDHWWSTMPDRYKLQFLREGLRVHPDWARAFVDYMDVASTPALHIELGRTREGLIAELKQLPPPMQPLDGGYLAPQGDPLEADVWEAQETEQAERVEQALKHGIDLFRQYLSQRNWPNSLLALQALYEAMIPFRAEQSPAWQAYGEAIEQNLQSLYHSLIDRLSETLLGPPIRRWLIEQVFSRWLFYEQHKSPTQPAQSPQYLWADWQLLLQLLASTRAQAQFLARKLDAHGLRDTQELATLHAYLQRVQAAGPAEGE